MAWFVMVLEIKHGAVESKRPFRHRKICLRVTSDQGLQAKVLKCQENYSEITVTLQQQQNRH